MNACAVTLCLVCVVVGGSLASVAVFLHGEGGYPCIRIPAIARCRGLLHAFAECRTRTGDGCIPALPAKPGVVAGVCYKHSSDDGATWSQLTLIVSGATQPTVVCDQQAMTLILQFNTGGSNWQVASTDNGASWSDPMGINLGTHNGTSVGPGRGLQLSEDSPMPGRILFIGHHGAYEYDLVWYSDDGGKSYQLSETVLEKMDEAQLVEGRGGSVVANMRNNHLSTCDCRAIATSNNGGKSFGSISYDPTLISPVNLVGAGVCMATVLRSSNGSLLFANPASKIERIHGMLRRSDDDGQTWSHSWVVTNSSFAYSCLTEVEKPSQTGLLWETSAEGCTGPSCQILFSKYTVL